MTNLSLLIANSLYFYLCGDFHLYTTMQLPTLTIPIFSPNPNPNLTSQNVPTLLVNECFGTYYVANTRMCTRPNTHTHKHQISLHLQHESLLVRNPQS